jgi:hypothetical protein
MSYLKRNVWVIGMYLAAATNSSVQNGTSYINSNTIISNTIYFVFIQNKSFQNEEIVVSFCEPKNIH